jgi:hypothetical protein
VHALNNAGIDVCTVDLPDRALTDIQVSAEYVVYAVRHMREHYHSKVDILGHSQGPRRHGGRSNSGPTSATRSTTWSDWKPPTTAQPPPRTEAQSISPRTERRHTFEQATVRDQPGGELIVVRHQFGRQPRFSQPSLTEHQGHS